MDLLLHRYLSTSTYTAGVLRDCSAGGTNPVLAYILEDALREVKIPKETCIPAGEYQLGLRREGGLAQHYDARYANIGHRGMVQILGIPNFTNCYFHIGNDIEDTEGCPLVGNAMYHVGRVGDSRKAYLRFYTHVYQAVADKKCALTIEETLL